MPRTDTELGSFQRDYTPAKTSNGLLRTPLNLRSGSIRNEAIQQEHHKKLRRQSHQPIPPQNPNSKVWKEIGLELKQEGHHKSLLEISAVDSTGLALKISPKNKRLSSGTILIDQNLSKLQMMFQHQQQQFTKTTHEQHELTPRGSKTKNLVELYHSSNLKGTRETTEKQTSNFDIDVPTCGSTHQSLKKPTFSGVTDSSSRQQKNQSLSKKEVEINHPQSSKGISRKMHAPPIDNVLSRRLNLSGT